MPYAGPRRAGSGVARAGQHIDYLTEQLKAFRAGSRGDIDGNTTSVASILTDADIATLAASP
ncbi:MAG TPA: hypothetical protein VGG57_18825 [Stellaceae bacterium]|jgi:cytochrome c553